MREVLRLIVVPYRSMNLVLSERLDGFSLPITTGLSG